ncbi:cobalamin biosynthesis protein [Commensalibacter melissae]|uniref:cobalamin biosynthesis protein n=1 Tax=Commensalibacter melissae TaxID=2070537 RepID=UPI0012D9042D|nr:cobalamin biosynthesis protein [Commensalibacter melissae]MUG09768.1 hypothetical protein [Commensalibacter melissae]
MVSDPTVPLPNIASRASPDTLLIGLGSQKKTNAKHIYCTLQEIKRNYRASIYLIAAPAFKQKDSTYLILQHHYKLPIQFIALDTLKNLQSQCQSYSNRIYELTGFGAVSEACLLAIMHEKDHLLMRKMIYKGVTLSLAYKGSSTP